MLKAFLFLGYFHTWVMAQQFLRTEMPAKSEERDNSASIATRLSADYSTIFNASSCILTVVHEPSKTEIYNADARNIVRTGRSNIGQLASQVILDGNLAKEPTVQKLSEGRECPNHASLSMGTEGSPRNVIQLDGEQEINLGGWLFPDKRTVPTRVRVGEAEDGVGVVIEASILDDTDQYDFVTINYDSPDDEEIYGLGLQYTEWNFKGKRVPIITSEGGVGRGLQAVTFLLNTFFSKGGGSPVTSYSPSRSYVTNKNRGVTFNSSAIGFYDFQK